MARSGVSIILLLLTVYALLVVCTTSTAGERKVVSLEGAWRIAEGDMDRTPGSFDHSVPVPGLVDMAVPPFEEVGAVPKDRRHPEIVPTDIRREAFWYRRDFTVAGPVPPVALLKIHKAKFGIRVFLNGIPVGEHPGNFTPGIFDLHPQLKGDGKPNELVVRVGSSPAAVTRGRPWGADYEKARYLPGLYDKVELIMSGTPHIVNVQVVPDVPNRSFRVVAEVANAGEIPTEVRVRAGLREAAGGRSAGQATGEPVTLAAGATQTIDLTVPVENGRLWTPEDPFLYILEIDTGADTLATRAGMRSVTTDPETGRMLLNGKPYYLRGSNVCIYRFFEDPLRGDNPWDRKWVETLHRRFKSMHWNSLRYCIGFPPEMWYDVADELGLLIQDEYPVWGGELDPELLATEYEGWMRARWNHPCVAIWDAQNETSGERGRITRDAVRKVRDLDLSGRPWDNGWGPPAAEGDICEAHPYVHRTNGLLSRRLVGMDKLNGVPHLTARGMESWKPYLINEYGWLWVNRDGTPTTLSNRSYGYPAILGPGEHSPERYRETYARMVAALTEFWRGRRHCAGVMHFCGLGYSRPGGQTSDNFVDIENLTLEPHFANYVRDAFAPVGVMIDYWLIRHQAARGTIEVPVVVTNDPDTPWQGKLALRLERGGALLAEHQRTLTVPPQGQATLKFPVDVPPEAGAYRLVAELRMVGGEVVRSTRDLEVFDPGLAAGCPTSSSSEIAVDGETYPAELAVDGKMDTRWSSEFSDPQWIAVDLGEVRRVGRVELCWERAAGLAYTIDVSEDGVNWRTVHRADQGAGGVEVIRMTPVPARWVRMHGTRRITRYGYSLWEMRVF